MKRGFLLGKKSTTPATKPAPPPQPAPSSTAPISPLSLPSTASFNTAPADSSTLHWTFHPPGAPSLALHATATTVAALGTTPYFRSSSASPSSASPAQPPPLPPFTPLFTLTDLPGKGKALVSTADLAPNSLVLLDRPLLVCAFEALPRQHVNALLSHALSRLAPERQTEFLDLSNCFPVSSEGAFLGRFETNALPIISLDDLPASAGADEATYHGLFPLAARLNHACDANCRFEWSAKEWRLEVRTNRAVRAGEELCVSYIVPFQKRKQRREELQRKYRFECQCGWCSLPDDLSAKKDEEREAMAKRFLQQWDAQVKR
ncbi:hypothetical protein JCM6882_008241 [Rhodosporidiobolus microsporus]